MEFMPVFKLGLLNGWLPLAIFYALFGLFLLLTPREIVKRLYDLPWFEGRMRILWLIGRLAAIGLILLLVFSPLKVGHPVFVLGGVVYLAGFIAIFWALFTYRATPLGQPVTGGLYRISRNPQAVGLILIMLGDTLAVGSWFAALTLGVLAAFYHLRIVGEERLCLKQYGEDYRVYRGQVPRYFLFF